ncbi:hypothetical protein F5Y14DRAFT_450828 [Nemania sp. NC0429]|nr:hypothetical protein F5Y14DRAFT_450828 [Nemania sp. NC0429]
MLKVSKAFEVPFTKLRDDYIKGLLGDVVYRELVMLEGVECSEGAQQLASAAAAAKTKRAAGKALEVPTSTRYSSSVTDGRQIEPEDIREAPTGQFDDDSYVSAKSDTASVPVVSDKAEVEDPVQPGQADSDQQLQRDEQEAIDKNNILDSRLRGNKPKKGAMREPDDRELGLVEDEPEK